MGWIAERLEDLYTPHEDILQAHVILIGHKSGQHGRQEAQIELRLAAATLSVTQAAKSPYGAVSAALKAIERQLRDFRTLEHIEAKHRSSKTDAALYNFGAARP
ncbi:MAG TPA: HPF/RaiA family ribosome-associated protein [Candidatus Tectomicrobia bacterium]|nr:HPF/RaiA family ribosome-associated protein [Candidatus Tectomicrobia bacterium]